MMNGGRILAQQSSKQLQSKSAMDEASSNSPRKQLYSCMLLLARGSKMMVDDGTTNQDSSSLRFSAKSSKMKKMSVWRAKWVLICFGKVARVFQTANHQYILGLMLLKYG